MKAVVNSPICPLMAEPRPDCELADETLFGMTVEVLEQTSPAYWRVRTHYRYEGYAPVSRLLPGDDVAEAWAALPKRVVLAKNFCDVMTGPKFQSWPVTTLTRGALLAVEGGPSEGWQGVVLPDGRVGYVRSGWLGEYHAQPMDLPEEELRRRLTDMAMLYWGSPYRWGGKTPAGIDCSGLVSMAYLLCGIVIYRDAHIREDFPIREIRREDKKPGDLLFFPGHVAMYLGEGRYCHSTGRAGNDGFAVNSLDPAAPDYRADLAEKLTSVGTYFFSREKVGLV